jgi:hypothetical protein
LGAKKVAATTVLLKSSSQDNDNGNDSDNDSMQQERTGYWNLPNDFSMFLTQRSIQSFMFLTSQLRDPETCYWVEDFTQPNLVKLGNSNSNTNTNTNNKPILDSGDDIAGDDTATQKENEDQERTCHLLRYHGLAAMDLEVFPTWESYFEQLLEQPTDTWIIAGHQSHIPDYTWEIDPNSLCGRILSVREQLSREFASDLQAVSDMGGQTFEWYWDKLKQSRKTEDENSSSSSSRRSSDGSTTPPIDPSSLRSFRENLLFLEINVDNPELDHKPSPLRRGNFDLLVLLATEEAIHRVLNRWEERRLEGDLNESESASQRFLEEFYQDRQDFFHGPLPGYGKADGVLEELLGSDLRFKNDSSYVIHPTKIAELVLKERERVALDWMAIAEEAPVHHMKIQKLRLDKMMTKGAAAKDASSTSGNGGETIGAGGSDSARNGGFDPGPGAFE